MRFTWLLTALTLPLAAAPAHATVNFNSGTTAAFPGKNGLIAFATNRDDRFNREIYTMRADGSNPTRLTNNSVGDEEPSWSADGKQIAYRSVAPGSNTDVFTMAADGSGQTNRTNGGNADYEPAWSPDGSKIAFTKFGGAIWTMASNGSGQAQLTPGNDDYPAWSPDGTKIAFAGLREGSDYEIYAMGADGSSPTALTANLADDTFPSWSPDGKKIAFTSKRDGNEEVYVMDADGTDQVRLTNDPAQDREPAWSPDGTKIAFATNRLANTNFEIYTMAPNGTGLTNLTNTPAPKSEFQPDWQPTAGGADPDPDPEPDPTPGVVKTEVTVKVPNARPVSRGNKSYRYTQIESLRRELEKLGVPFKVKATGVPFKNVAALYQDTIEDGEVFSQPSPPKPGERVKIDPGKPCKAKAKVPCRLEFSVKYYDQADDLRGETCPYRDSRKVSDLLEKKTYQDAVEVLGGLRCKYRIVKYVESKTDTEERIRQARVRSERRKKANGQKERVYFVDLEVSRPKRSDFIVSVAPRPWSDFEDNPQRADDFNTELDLGKDGKLTFSTKNKGVIQVIVTENFTGRFISNLVVELVKNPAGRPQDAKIIGSSQTNKQAAVTFSFPVDWTGDLQVNVRVKAKRTREDLVEDTMRGWITIPVIERSGKELLTTQSGRRFKLVGNRWKHTTLFNEALIAFNEGLKNLTKWAPALDGACEAALGTDANATRAVETCWMNGVAVVKSSNGGTTVGTGLAKRIDAPGYVVRDDGQLAGATIPGAVIPGTQAVIGAAIISDNGGGLISNGIPTVNLRPDANLMKPGAPLLGDAGAALVGKVKDVSFISDQGGGVVSNHGGHIISNKGGGLISDKGAALVPIAGAPVISDHGLG